MALSKQARSSIAKWQFGPEGPAAVVPRRGKPDGATKSAPNTIMLPNASKRNKFTRGKPQPIPNVDAGRQGGRYT